MALVNFILSIPIEVRLTLLFLLGTLLGGQLNRGIYRLAWNRRAIGPWSLPLDGVPSRHWSDRLPIVGWWGLRREAAWHGRGYWVRPLLLELGTGIFFAVLYWLETDQLMLWPSLPGLAAPEPWVVHAQYFSHIILVALMIVATFIDFDEQTIPDEITVSGTVIALLLALAVPNSFLPTLFQPPAGVATVNHMVVTSSNISGQWGDGLGGVFSWPPSLDGLSGVALVLLGIGAWCFAIMHKTWTLRYGVVRAVRYMLASIVRRGTWRLPAALALMLWIVALATWLLGSGEQRTQWQGFVTAVAGICFGGGLIWAVRIIAGHAMRVEAMGFGDVTLMAMIGAFLGWQAAFMIFFLAPLSALFVATAQRVVTGERHIAFGPYLCISTLILLFAWDSLWTHWAQPLFAFGWFIPGVLALCLILMGGLLWMWRIVRDLIFG